MIKFVLQDRNHKLLFSLVLLSLTFLLVISSFHTLASAATNPFYTSVNPSSKQLDPLAPTSSPTPTITATPTPLLMDVLPSTTPLILFMPILSKSIPPTPTPTPTIPPVINPTTLLSCNSRAINIPDNDPTGVSSNLLLNEPEYILDLDIRIDLSHTWIGDLIVSLTHGDTASQIRLIDQPGLPATSNGCDQDNIEAILDDEVTLPVENRCSSTIPSISGIYKPEQPLSTFIGENLNGTWTLNVSDNYTADTGSLIEWCIAARISSIPAAPTPTPNVGSLPSHAQISRISGQSQALPLDCESRSAVDWAAYFGVKIDEFDFFYSLPESDNPDEGFVGNVYGAWGQIPPYPYGVHAKPVAAVLRDYGLEAYAHRPLSWDELRAEIAAGRPVIVWIVGNVINGIPVYVVNGIPVYYQSKDGDLTIVARYEHTVIVTGYTSDSVSYLNGGTIYTISLNQFLESWSVMGNMAITARP